jgi:squalene-associated FAD-dependent desaturase
VVSRRVLEAVARAATLSEVAARSPRSIEDVIVVGAGVAGLAAAVALSDAGYKVTVLERRPFVGGRASSYEHPALHEVIDCQHVLLGCCTNLIDLFERVGASDAIRWYETVTFLEPGGRRSDITPSWLPAPLHASGSFLRARMLDTADKLAIARGMAEFIRGMPLDDSESVASWLKRSGQTDGAIRHFWEPVLVVTLNDSFENCSLRYAAKVFRELFLKTSTGSRLGIPKIPLGDLYGIAARHVVEKGSIVHARVSVEELTPLIDGRWAVKAEGQSFTADAVVLATSVDQAQRLLTNLPAVRGSVELGRSLGRYVLSPYITAHLWFERAFTDLHHAALLDTTYQWMFHKSRIRNWAAEKGSYVELVIGGSRELLKAPRAELVTLALDDLSRFFPDVHGMRLVKSGVLKEARATFSVIPGMDRDRPKAQSPWPGLFLAGDWTATDWPSTMEGAARSGYLAAEAVVGASGGIVCPDLRATGLMRVLGR